MVRPSEIEVYGGGFPPQTADDTRAGRAGNDLDDCQGSNQCPPWTTLVQIQLEPEEPVEPDRPAVEPTAETPRRPDWHLVTVFYAVCFGLVSLIALGLSFAGANFSVTGAQLTFQFTIAFLYMPAPLISALIAERVGRRRPLIRTTFAGFGCKLPRLLLTYAALSTAVYLTYLLFAYLFGNIVHVPGVGDLVTSQAGLTENVTTMFADIAKGRGLTPPAAESLNMPPLALLYVIALVGGLVAGSPSTGCSPSARSTDGAAS